MATTREPITHKLKTWPESFRAAASGRKRFEIRKDDRDPPFEPGDLVELHEFDPFDPDVSYPPRMPTQLPPRAALFTGRVARFYVGYVERSAALPPGWCGLQLVTADEINLVGPAMGRSFCRSF